MFMNKSLSVGFGCKWPCVSRLGVFDVRTDEKNECVFPRLGAAENYVQLILLKVTGRLCGKSRGYYM